MKASWQIIMIFLIQAVIGVLFLLSGTAPAIAVEYKYITIPTPAWWETVYPMDINNKGTVVGELGGPMGGKGFVYNDGIYTELLPTLITPARRFTYAVSVNNNGAVVGTIMSIFLNLPPFITLFLGVNKVFIYREGFTIKLRPPGWSEAYAYYISDNGTVLGLGRERLNGKTKWFIYDDWKYTVLLPPGWSEVDQITDMNSSGDVVGRGYNEEKNAERGFLYREGRYTEMVPPGFNYSSLHGINDNGEMILSAWNDNWAPPKHFIYSNNTYTEIAIVPLYINNAGAVIGEALENVPDFAYSKKVLYHDGNYTVLLPPGWRWVVDIRINNRNEVAGWGIDGNGINKVFIYSSGEYTELLPPGWTDATTESHDVIGRMTPRTFINNNGTVTAYGHDAHGSQKAFIAVPATN
jgi:hypothetical protein